MTEISGSIGAVILAAGQSSRMGRPKLTLPWGKHTVIEQVVSVVRQAGIAEIVVVTGGAREEVEAVLAQDSTALRMVYNAHYRQSEMLVSLQTGTRVLKEEFEALQALLVVLGDQPQIDASVISTVIRQYQLTGKSLVIPSYQMHRGHPWLVARALWDTLLIMEPERTMRDFLISRGVDIAYAEVDSPVILSDLDTPDDYEHLKNKGFK